MFTKKSKGPRASDGGRPTARGRGRPPGPTEQSAATRERLFRGAIALIAERGYEATTLRDVARDAGVSVGLLYRYFPSKRAVVFALHDALSVEYADAAAAMGPGPWRERFLFALHRSLAVLGRERAALVALTSVLVGDRDQGLFAPATADARRRVQEVFVAAVVDARDAPPRPDAEALGRLLYLVHLAVILGWLLDRSPNQRATTRLLALLEGQAPTLALLVGLAPARALVRRVDELVRDALDIGDDRGSRG